jgi:hypothetical protein
MNISKRSRDCSSGQPYDSLEDETISSESSLESRILEEWANEADQLIMTKTTFDPDNYPEEPPRSESFPTSCAKDCLLRRPYDPPEYRPLSPTPPPAPEGHAEPPDEAPEPPHKTLLEGQIRLLIIEPGVLGTPLNAELVVADMDQIDGAGIRDIKLVVPYVALSYTWGAPQFPRTLKIGAHNMHITENLFGFLQRFRQPVYRGFLWVDALCINQKDHLEKATQVNNMLTVYKKARSVIVWLGEHGPHTELAAAYLRSNRKMLASDEVRRLRLVVRNSEGDTMKAEKCEWHATRCARNFAHLRSGIEDLCSREWVRRVWVRQEVWAASAITVWCGSSTLSWDAFKSGLRVTLASARWKSGAGGQSQLTHTTVMTLQLSKRQTRALARLPEHVSSTVQPKSTFYTAELLDQIISARTCKSTDPRDRVYALLGMSSAPTQLANSSPVRPEAFTIDYNLSPAEVFQNFAKFIAAEKGILFVLHLYSTFGSDINGDCLASWCPDWRKLKYPPVKKAAFLVSLERPIFSLSNGNTNWTIPTIMDPNVLNIRGCRLGTVLDDVNPGSKRLVAVRVVPGSWNVHDSQSSSSEAGAQIETKPGEVKVGMCTTNSSVHHLLRTYLEVLKHDKNEYSQRENAHEPYLFAAELKPSASEIRAAIGAPKMNTFLPILARPGDTVIGISGGEALIVLRERPPQDGENGAVCRWTYVGLAFLILNPDTSNLPYRWTVIPPGFVFEKRAAVVFEEPDNIWDHNDFETFSLV